MISRPSPAQAGIQEKLAGACTATVTIGELIREAAQITAGVADGYQKGEQWTLVTLIARAAGLEGDMARFAVFRAITQAQDPEELARTGRLLAAPADNPEGGN
jgi:hypothetical protein